VNPTLASCDSSPWHCKSSLNELLGVDAEPTRRKLPKGPRGVPGSVDFRSAVAEEARKSSRTLTSWKMNGLRRCPGFM